MGEPDGAAPGSISQELHTHELHEQGLVSEY